MRASVIVEIVESNGWDFEQIKGRLIYIIHALRAVLCVVLLVLSLSTIIASTS